MIATSFEEYPQDGRMYLVSTLTDRSAFYVCDGEPIYAAKVEEEPLRKDIIETNHLKLMLSAELVLVEGAQPNKPQCFNIIRLTSCADKKELVAFIDLCSLHANGKTALSFEDFFYALNELFRPLGKQQRIDAVGLFGELALIDYVANETGLDISKYWQIDGYHSKYDFTMPLGNIEVKTSGSSLEATIKHKQLFNEDKNALTFVAIEHNSSGESLGCLSKRLLASDNCFLELQSQIELNKRLLQIGEKDLGMPYCILTMRCYWAESLNFFGEISDRVSRLTYRLKLADLSYIAPQEAVLTLDNDGR